MQINGKDQSTEINPYTNGQLIYNKGAKNIQWGEDRFFNNWNWDNWTATCKRINKDHYTYTQVNSKRTWDLNLHSSTIPETKELQEEDTGSNLFDIGLGDFFLI